MFPKSNLERKLNVQIATSVTMEKAIENWMDMYKNHPPWVGGPNDVRSLNLPSTISEEMARLILTEFSITVDGSPRANFISEQLENFISTLNITVEMWCALGGIVLKPYVAGDDENGNPDRIEVDVIQATRFYPTSFNSNKEITGAVFVDSKRIGDYIYTRLEHHELTGTHYTVVNKAFQSERLNQSVSNDDAVSCRNPFSMEVPLESVDGWEGIAPIVELDDVYRPLFVYIRQPRANNIDPQSPLGVSVYSRAVDTIMEIDKQFSRILWEYEATEAAVYADTSLFNQNRDGSPILPQGKERLFRTFDFENQQKKSFIEAFSPQIRDSALFNGLNQLLRKCELQVGLAYGTLSDAEQVDRTATEVKQSKQRSFTTVNAQQTAFDSGIKCLVETLDMLCSIYGIGGEGVVNQTCTWGDGVLEDTDVEYQRRWAMVTAGKLKLEKFIAWYFGCSEEDAKEYIPEATPDDPLSM